jgi:transposase
VIAVSPKTRVFVCVAAVDFRKGIDGLSRTCRDVMAGDPFSGAMFVFRSRSGTALRILAYDGQGFWLCHKRLSAGRFRHWPEGAEAVRALAAHQLQVLLAGGDAEAAKGAPMWKPLDDNGTAGARPAT